MRRMSAVVTVVAPTVAFAMIGVFTGLSTNSPAATGDVYPHIWSTDSPAYKSLPADAPVDPDSALKVATMKKWGIQYYGDKTRGIPSMTLNTTDYSNPLWVAHNSDPAYDIQFHDCQNKGYIPQDFINALKRVHIPDNARPSAGTDGQMAIYNADTGRYVDLWVSRKSGNTWSACWGGSIANAATSNTAVPGYLGTSASGLALEPYTVKIEELKAGYIDHPVAFAVPPEAISRNVSKPAVRTDGDKDPNDPSMMAEAQFVRLPANFNIDALKLNRTQRIMAKAAKEYGFVLVDRAGAIGFSFQNPTTYPGPNPYPQLFGGLAYWQVMWGDQSKGEVPFPFDSLQVLKRDYLPNGPMLYRNNPPTPTSPTPTSPAPTSPAPTSPAPTSPTTSTTTPPSPAPSTPTPGGISFTTDQSADTFGFTASAMPAGATMRVEWDRGGQRQSTTVTGSTWWSGSQPGWSKAQATVRSSSGAVLATSPVLNPGGQPNQPTPATINGWKNGQSFGFTASSIPAGGNMTIRWTRGGQTQSTSVTRTEWSSGTQIGWSNARATVSDASGAVVGTSVTLNP